MWAKRIGDALSIPDDFSSDDFPSEWSEPMHHATSGGPLKAALIDKTQGALHAIYSGVLIWAARRLERMTDVKALEDLAVMLFCYQHDPDYLFAGEEPPGILDSSRAEKYRGTEMYLRYLIFYQFWSNGWNWPLLPHYSTVAEAISLARYHMGPKQRATFDPWVEGIISRMNVLAPLTEHADLTPNVPEPDKAARRLLVMGPPIPPQLLDLRLDPNGLDMSAASREFLTTVDWRDNRYLKSPKDIVLASGGRPYQDPR
jgi:hypothetical protein